MDVLAAAPFSASSLEWQNLPAQWMLTVVAKATYTLRPGTSPLAPERDAIADHDNYWDDDTERSLFVASDLAPVKPRPEVTLVGSAFAPRGEPVRSLVVRLRVGSVDKTIEVFVPRTLMAEGQIREGAPWKQMPLLYERAAGGLHSWNPRGMSADSLDRHGRRSLPNLQRPGLGVHPPDPIEPIGFGPLAPSWSIRRERLGIRATTWSDASWAEKPLGVGFDRAFFQTAPADQLLDELAADQAITLENLLPDHPLLTTRLAPVRPRAKVESAEGSSWDVELVPDTLAIDTNRGTCTLAWRGHVEVDRPRFAGRILVGAEEPTGAMRWPAAPRTPSLHDGHQPSVVKAPAASKPGLTRPAASRPPPPPRPPSARPVDADALNKTVDEDDARAALSTAALPFRSSGSIPPPRPSARPPAPPPPRQSMPSWHDDRTEAAGAGATPSMPAWLAQSDGIAPGRPSGPGVPAAPVEPPARVAPPPLYGPRPSVTDGALVAPPPQLASLGSLGRDDEQPAGRVFSSAAPAPDRVSLGKVNERALGVATYGGVLQASNAAVDHEPSGARANGKREAPRLDAGSRSMLELLWFDAAVLPVLRADEVWSEYVVAPPELEPPPEIEGGEPEAAPVDPDRARAERAAERATVMGILARAPGVHDAEGALLRAASDDGAFIPPLGVIGGELETPLDELETLKILMAAAGPLAPTDKKLKEVVDLAQEVMKTPLGASREVASGFVGRVREAWAKASRLLPADYLDHHARRLLLDQRLYQKRQLRDAEWVRTLLTPPGASTPIPVYLPAAVARHLPLFTRFTARVLGEIVPQQDETESASVAVRASALARVIPPKPRR